MYIRSDYIFSYWIFFWFILYLLKIIHYNPKLIIILGIIEVTIALIYFIIRNALSKEIIKFIIINIFIKVIPLLIIYKDPIKKEDIISTFIFILLYIFWMIINNVSIIEVYKKINNSYLSNKAPKTYFSKLYDDFYNKLFS